MNRSTCLAVLLATLGASLPARAAVVTYTLYVDNAAQGPGTFKLTAKASLGDNFGIAGYNVQLVGNSVEVPTGSILTVNHNSLRATSVTNALNEEGTAGFTNLRTPDLAAGGSNHSSYTLSGVQDTVTPTPHLIRGLGQTGGSLAALGLTGSAPEGNPWTSELTLLLGTFVPVPGGGSNGIARGIDFIAIPTALTTAKVWSSANGISSQSAAFVRVFVPEPAAATLAGVGLAALTVARRRRSSHQSNL